MPQIVAKPVGGVNAPQGVLYLGDTLTINAVDGDTVFKGISLTNTRTGESRAVAAGDILGATTLPGFDASATVQVFTLTIVTSTGTSERELDIATDRSAQTFPNPTYQVGAGKPSADAGPQSIATPGAGAWFSADSTTGPQIFIDRMKVDWHLDGATITSKAIDRTAVKLPDGFKSAPPETKFIQYHIVQKFPLYVIPGTFTASGVVEAFAPASLDVVLTQTDPSDMMTLTANAL